MLYSHYPKSATDILMNVLGTHDTERILTVLGGKSSDGLTNEQLSTMKMSADERKIAKNKLKMAYLINATVPGIPCIFYGDEAGMEGYRDPFNRLPFPWGEEDQELLDFYRKIGKVRASENLYKDGFFKLLHCDSNCLAFARYNEKTSIITFVNRGEKSINIDASFSLKNLLTNKIQKSLSSGEVALFKTKKSIENLTFSIE
jgi:glycosidase